MVHNFLHRESVNRMLKLKKWAKPAKKQMPAKTEPVTPTMEEPVEEPVKKTKKKSLPIEEEINNNVE